MFFLPLCFTPSPSLSPRDNLDSSTMSERKAINKWYPPDYDPSKLPKKKKSTNPNINRVRLMVPFSMKCVLCNEYIAAHRKFNARKEITSDKYMGVKIIHFHIKCPRCNGQLVFRTDPKTSGFEPVSGVIRNYVSSKQKVVEQAETEDEMLERLERQERENQEYQEQKHKRKNNPFWRSQDLTTGSTTLESLEEKLLEQQKEQQMHDQLTFLQAKAIQLQQCGGADAAILRAQEKLTSEKRLLDQVSIPKRPKHFDTSDDATEPRLKVLGQIKVNLNNPKNLQNLKNQKNSKSTESSESSSKISEVVALAEIAGGAYARHIPHGDTRQKTVTEDAPFAEKPNHKNKDTTEKSSNSDLLDNIPPNPTSLGASLAGYSSSEED